MYIVLNLTIKIGDKSNDAQLTRAASNLVLWDNNLAGECILGVWNWVLENADAANHLAHLFHLISEVARVTNYTVGAGNLYECTYTLHTCACASTGKYPIAHLLSSVHAWARATYTESMHRRET